MTYIKEKVEDSTIIPGEGLGDHFIRMCMSLPRDSEVYETKRTLITSYQNTTENSTVYVYQCTDGKEVWREERLKRINI